MAIDKEAQVQDIRNDSADDVINVSATGDLEYVSRAIRCQVGGTLTVTMKSGRQNVALRFKDGETRPVRVSAITNLGTCTGVEVMV